MLLQTHAHLLGTTAVAALARRPLHAKAGRMRRLAEKLATGRVFPQVRRRAPNVVELVHRDGQTVALRLRQPLHLALLVCLKLIHALFSAWGEIVDLAFDEWITRHARATGVQGASRRDGRSVGVAAERLHVAVPVILELVVRGEAAMVRMDVGVTPGTINLVVDGLAWAA